MKKVSCASRAKMKRSRTLNSDPNLHLTFDEREIKKMTFSGCFL